MKTLTFNLIIDSNRSINGDLRFNSEKLKCPIAIVMHGFKGNRNWGFLPTLTEQFAEMGYIAINYDHSLNGNIPGSIKYNMDKFRQITISAQLQELEILIAKIKSGELFQELDINKIWNGEIVLCGHSMGAAIALVYATENKIDKLIMMSPISKFDRYTERQKIQWRIDGQIEFYNPKIEQTMSLNSNFIDDMDANLKRFDLLAAIAKCNSQILIVHGEQDMTVQIKESQALYDYSDKNKCEFYKLAHCNHSFNIDNLGLVNNPILNELQNCVCEFAKID